jgi:membrane protein
VLRNIFGLFKAAFHDWREDRADRLGAALAYYTVLSIPPLLILLIGIAGLAFGRDAVEGRITGTLEHLMGPQGGAVIREMLAGMREERRGIVAIIVGFVTLLLGASGVFGHLKDALDTIWEVESKKGGGLKAFLGKYVFSLLALLGTGFLLIVSLAMTALLGALGDYLGRSLPGGEGLWHAINAVVSLGVIAISFAFMFRYIPDARVAWRQALLGGLVTSILFTLGEAAIGFYMGKTNVGSAFGVAGSLVVLLVWVYYSAQIFFFGAEFTQALGARYGAEPWARGPRAET